jgi:multidrug efflux pump subunit AcrA (membrane-fusion protein)
MAKLMLRAFNGESDAAIAKARYDNVVTLEQRITKSCEEVNKLGHSNRICVTRPYYELKLAELHLVHEHREKVQAEKDAQRAAKEQMREEVRAQEELERIQAETEKEETQRERALAKARAELAKVSDATAAANAEHTNKLEALVSRLENELKETLDRKAKAIARAQLTRSGHVYVLSNVGSFGEGIYKIGMTRRFEPLERVDELGDASVPFPFDVHAIIYCEDAPTLENALHREFANRRINRVNGRKEYFRVSLDEIRVAVEKLHGLVTFVLTPEAEEWRKTRALLEANEAG